MDFTGLLIGKGLQIGADRALSSLFDTDLGDLIEESAQEWADELPDEVGGHRETLLRALLQEGKPRERLQEDETETEAREKLSGRIRHQRIPKTATWHTALVERWEEVNERLDEEEAHSFFQLQQEDAEAHLRDLADQLNSTCAQDEDLFQRTVYRLLKKQSEARELGAPWRTPAEFFAPRLHSHRLFRHTWDLVGRGEILDSLKDFALQEPSKGDPIVAFLPGRGGVGKSKIAYHLSKQIQGEHDRIVRFIDRGQEVEPEDLRLLPDEDVFIIVDDAQEREDIRTLVNLLERRSEDYKDKLFILTRPSATERLKSDLTYSGLDPSEYVELGPLESLDRDDIRSLAREALGDHFLQHTEHLVDVAGDSPLVVVVGGQLIQQELISPELLERSEEFREVVLGRFRDTLVGDISDQFDSRQVKRVLEVTAALSPVRPEDDDYLELASEFLNTEVRAIEEIYQQLEETGVLLRRGGLVRITPDVLSDHILHDACVYRGNSTDFAQDVYNQFAERAAERLLPNLAELDWRLNQSDDSPPGVLQEVWDDIENRFDEADWRERSNLLKQIKGAARYLPRQVLRLAERAIQKPIEVEDEHRDGFIEAQIARDVTEILRRVGFSLDFLPRSLQILWEMTADESTSASQKAHSKLKDIAGYGRWKPPRVQKIALDAAEEWLDAGDAFDREPKRCLIDVVEPILKKSAESSYTEGHTSTIAPFVVNRESRYIRSLRKRAFRFIQDYSTSPEASLWSALRVLKIYIDMLSGPTPMVNMDITSENRKQFDPERVWALGGIQKLREQWDSPVLDLAIVRRLYWHAEHGRIQRLRRGHRCLKEIVGEIEPSFEFRLARCLQKSINFRMPDTEDHPEGFEQHAVESATLRRGTVQDFLERFSEPDDGARQIESRLSQLDDLRDVLTQSPPDPGSFLQYLTDEDSGYGAQLIRYAIKNPDSYIASNVGEMISTLGQTEADQAFQLIQEAVEVDDTLARSVAQSHEAWHEIAQDQNVDMWGKVLRHPSRKVRLAALRALKSLALDGKVAPVFQHAPRTLVNDDLRVADKLFSLFDGHAIDPDDLDDTQIEALLDKLETVSHLDKHWVRSFLDHASHRVPEAVFELLIERLEVAKESEVGYHMIGPGRIEESQSPEKLNGLRECGEYENMLREVRSYFLSDDVSLHMAMNLFLSLSNGLDETSLEVLTEWIESGNEEKMKAVSRIFRKAAYDFTLENTDFVQDVLEKTKSHSREMLQRFKSVLHASAALGSRSGIPHHPFPKNQRLKDEAREIADDLPAWSVACEFYEELSQRAEKRIEENLRRDEELEMQ